MLIRVLLLITLLAPAPVLAQLRWQEGRHYTVLQPAVVTSVPAGKVEVVEVFSYGCIHCYRAKDEIAKLKASLPVEAVMTYVHASFVPGEAWPMLQRAWYTAQALGIGEAIHDQMFAAVWETGEMPLLDKNGNVRNPLPTIEDAARFYAHYSPVKFAEFLRVARSKEIDAQVQRADALVVGYGIAGTPSLIVNGRYVIDTDALGSWADIRQLVSFLVGQERRRLQATRPAKQ
jgi:thiol:disulfide interchange protein DsbA